MIDIVTLEEFLPLLSTPQQKAPSTMDTPLHLEPEFAWVFKNVDYEDWEKPNSECRRLLLTGREESNINMVSSHYTNEGTARTQGWVLHFCYPYAIDSEPATSLFIQTLLRQIISYLPGGLKVSFVKAFLRSVWATRSFEDDDLSNPQENWISSLLKMAGSYSLLSALDPILEYMKEPKLLVIIDGLDGTHQGRRDFFRNISSFCTLIVREHPNVRVLLTSQPTEGVVRELDGFSRIAFDEERKGFLPLHQFTRSQANDNTEECLQSLFFENTRRENIARGHNGSFEWLWEREEYKEWSESDNSSVLLVLGKPGSGKSTLTKYFSENLAKREPNAKSATVARYFYTARQGELQADHRSMLQSMIYDILDQNPPLFYFGIQHEYRKLLKSSQDDGIVWPYDVLKKVMLLLQHYPSQERLYLIIDALDEARQEDTRDVLDLLYNICASARHCVVKVFVASRPVGLLNRYVNQLSNILTLQDHTKPDIENFTHSFIENLERSNSLKKAADYIIQNAQGVFVWVELVGRQLQEYDAQGRPLGDIFKFLLTLPRELEEMYELMFEIMPKEDGVIQDSVKIFQLVLFARRLLTGREIVHALRIPDDPAADFTPSDTFIQDEIPEERYIMVCGGNFLAHSRQNGKPPQTWHSLFHLPFAN
jgi:energy-coupling factor transporter ATP-binding protein EcfA2